MLEKPFVALGERLGSDVLARCLPFLASLGIFAGACALPSRSAKSRYLLLAAASPLLFLYAAEARAYALLALECLGLFLLATRGVESPRRLVVVALLSAAALFTHYLALFALGALVLVAAAEKRVRTAVAFLLGASPFLAWVPTMVAQPHEAVAWMHEPPSELFTGILSSLGGAGDIPRPFGPPLPVGLEAAAVGVALVIAVALIRRWREDSDVRRAGAFIVFFFGGVVFASFLRPVAFAGRTEVAILPVWLWLAARAGDQSRTVRIASVAVMVVAAASSAILLLEPREPAASDRALESIERIARPGDVLVAGAYFYLPARLEADRGRLKIPVQPVPVEQSVHPGWSLSTRLRREDLAAVMSVLDRTPKSGRVFFQVPPFHAAALRGLLARRGVTKEIVRTPEMVVLGWSRVRQN